MLPKAPRGFEWITLAGGPALVCRPLEEVAPHFFTTREWLLCPREDGNVSWAKVAASAGVAPDRLLRLRQVHRADAVVVRPNDRPFDAPPAADIIASDDGRLAMAVQAADCVPLLIADPRTGAAAAAHAGWRGLAARVPQNAVAILHSEFGSRPGDLLAAVGPSIGPCCYEVGGDVRSAFGPQLNGSATWFTDASQSVDGNPPFRPLMPRPGKWFFDSWRAARDQLIAAGVPGVRIYVAALCTASHADLFCSYRRDGPGAGRIAGVIRPRPRTRADFGK